MPELNFALHHASNTQPGPDKVQYNMLKHLPEVAQQHLLDIFNKMWIETFIPQKWKEATIIPIPKPNKDHSDPTNYRPIALTSCVCKVLEKMINNRLQQYLENNKLLTKVQCGFRKSRSIVDHLIRLDTYIRRGMAEDKCTVAVMFDLEKAYDKAWRYGIVRDLQQLVLRGRLPMFIQEFLKDRTFKVTVNWTESGSRHQEEGVSKEVF